MTISDLIIIYFACGAPFAVYFYLQNRERLFSGRLIFRTVLNYLFWIPVSLRYALKKRTGRKANGLHGRRRRQIGETVSDASLETIQKQIERFAELSAAPINFYDLREIINRYIGLSLAVGDEPAANGDGQRFFEIADVKNAEIGAICRQRRNRQRLLFHQRQAAEDFSQAVFQLARNIKNPELPLNLSVRLTDLLNDAKTGAAINDFIVENVQNKPRQSVANVEKSLWNMPPRQSNARQVSLNLNTLNRTKLRLKD